MPNKPGNDDRNQATGMGGSGFADRNGQRDASSEGGHAGGNRSRSNRGFASMDRGKQKEIASKGGRAAHAKGTAHEFDSGEAREAGRKGGVAVSRNREHMAAIGRRGGEARGNSRTRQSAQTNTGSSEASSGALQNTRGAERQVAISNEREGVGAPRGEGRGKREEGSAEALGRSRLNP